MRKTNHCVVRNQAHQRGGFNLRERHNERKNESYGNGDIVPERTDLNIHFKSCDGTYEQAFNQLVDKGAISLRGLKKDAKVFDELVFDVNSGYFEDQGGYAYAKAFFAEAYQLAVEEAGSEEYVLSAVMHADERNKALSEKLGYDVFHYHLHVVYIPVVDKEVKWTKRCKDPALVGTVKEVIKQVSHSKKWPRYKEKEGWVNSYSLLQDRFYEHMKAAGFAGFERGERGSTAEHLSVLDYKIQQDEARAAVLEEDITEKEHTAASLDKQLEKSTAQLSSLQKNIAIVKQNAATFAEIDNMVKKNLFGKMELSPAHWQTVSNYAKEGIKSRPIISNLKKQLAGATKEIESRKAASSKDFEETKLFRQAVKMNPQRVKAFLQDIIQPKRDQRKAIQKQKNSERGR